MQKTEKKMQTPQKLQSNQIELNGIAENEIALNPNVTHRNVTYPIELKNTSYDTQ